ncbi:hypothetical protein LB505_004904 [Fusarium chuoi]|nr:hypothetical protein LB505_004904 [Fusarium chuoi]
MTGRELLREIEKPSAAGLLISMTNAAGGPAAYEFVFTGWHDMADVRFTEAVDGTLFWMTSTSEMRGAHPGEHRISKARCTKPEPPSGERMWSRRESKLDSRKKSEKTQPGLYDQPECQIAIWDFTLPSSRRVPTNSSRAARSLPRFEWSSIMTGALKERL